MTQTDASFLPFGFQYYRSPTPFRDQWERDLKNIADKGFNCVKYWVQWRASVPEENRYEFGDIAELMDLAERFGLKVVLNVIFDVAPAWFYKKYPDSKMIAADGSVVEPRALSYRQIGGAPGPCYHHGQAQAEKDRFLEAAVLAFKDHPALWVWDLWNEPELTTGIKRSLTFDNQVCYCEHSLTAFGGWLEQKYGTLEAFNEKWQRNYADWSEVEPPRGQAVFNDLVDWRLFMSDALTDDLIRRVDVVKRHDLVHQVMVHTVPAPIFNLITAGSDDFKLAEPCDLFGNSLGSSAWSADLLLSAAKGKKVINSEIHALPGHTALKPKPLDFRELKRHLLIPLARGITGYLFWQYRPEVLGHEAPAWGSTYLDGSETPWLRDMAKLNGMMQRNRELLCDASRPSDGMAILISPENQIVNFSVYAHLDTYNDSVQGAHKLMHDLNYKVEFIHEGDLSKEMLSRYRCLWMPYPLYMSSAASNTIREWVGAGGTLISECSFGAIQAENGTHSYEVPGYGFGEVFGVREKWIHSAEHLDHSYHNLTLRSQELIPLAIRPEGWENAKSRLERSGSKEGPKEALLGTAGYGSYYQSEVELAEGTRVLADFAKDGSPALAVAAYGKGKAVWIGTLLAAAYWKMGHASTAETLGSLLREELGLRPYVGVTGGCIRADLSVGKDGASERSLLFVHNWGETSEEAEIALPLACAYAEPWFADGKEAARLDPARSDRLAVRLEAGDIQVYELHGVEKR
ncbi:beta-galactosidase [Cohnella phaseoli]|uniref:Beta-galactosidase n=1 Tax=Cohnella phaseoli TaxID=456490 RepID=A0A3D9KGS7_9BACL|nr:alpha-amylase family protein [Cohnella phaseoli]RED85559.1 beta-galactosidase [Cohnella phaseoli]